MGRTTVGGRAASNLDQATTAMFMVAATISSMLHHDFNRLEFFVLSVSFRSSMA